MKRSSIPRRKGQERRHPPAPQRRRRTPRLRRGPFVRVVKAAFGQRRKMIRNACVRHSATSEAQGSTPFFAAGRTAVGAGLHGADQLGGRTPHAVRKRPVEPPRHRASNPDAVRTPRPDKNTVRQPMAGAWNRLPANARRGKPPAVSRRKRNTPQSCAFHAGPLPSPRRVERRRLVPQTKHPLS